MQTSIARPGGERGGARRLDRAVQGLVVRDEVLVVRPVTRTGRVEDGDDESGVFTPDAARGLDVLRARLRLTHHRHEP